MLSRPQQQTKVEKVRTVLQTVILFGTVVSMGLGLLTFIIVQQLQPIYANIKEVKANLAVNDNNNVRIKQDLLEYKREQAEVLKSLVTKDQIKSIERNLDKIAGQVDFIYQKNFK